MSRFLRRAPSATPVAAPADKGPISHTPILSNPSALTPSAPTAPLTGEQQRTLSTLRAYGEELHVQSWTDDKEREAYQPWERRWLDDQRTAVRYARAAKWDLENAKKRLQETLTWRRSYRPELISPDEVKEEGRTGKQVISGFDTDGRPVLYLRPGRENTKPSPTQVRFLVFALERALDVASSTGQDTLAIVVDYASATQASNPSLGTARAVLSVLQHHYVETLGKAFVVRTPWWVSAFFAAMGPFLDPATRAKISINGTLDAYVDKSQLDAEFGGQHNFVWDFDTYWQTLLDTCGLLPDGTRRHGAPRTPSEAFVHPALSSAAGEASSASASLAVPGSAPTGSASASSTPGETFSTFLSHPSRTGEPSRDSSHVGSATPTEGATEVTAPSTAPTSVTGHQSASAAAAAGEKVDETPGATATVVPGVGAGNPSEP